MLAIVLYYSSDLLVEGGRPSKASRLARVASGLALKTQRFGHREGV